MMFYKLTEGQELWTLVSEDGELVKNTIDTDEHGGYLFLSYQEAVEALIAINRHQGDTVYPAKIILPVVLKMNSTPLEQNPLKDAIRKRGEKPWKPGDEPIVTMSIEDGIVTGKEEVSAQEVPNYHCEPDGGSL